jgi:hypothetical protein
MTHGDPDEQERATPDCGKHKKDRPIASVHGRADHVRLIAVRDVDDFRLLAIKRLGGDGFHDETGLWASLFARQQMLEARQ